MLAARSALALALMGAVNAVATLTGCLAALIWWACHRPNRLWMRFTAWWALCAVLAIAWWVVPLVMLGRISPPFLDFIESSGVTTQWTSLTEMLRGTDSWTPFVAPNATAGASLVTGTVAVLATTLVAAAGLAGLAMRTMPARGRLVTILLHRHHHCSPRDTQAASDRLWHMRFRHFSTPTAHRCATCTSSSR